MPFFLRSDPAITLVLSLILLGLIYPTNAVAKSVIVCAVENHPGHWVARQVLKKVYRHADLDVEFALYPNRRSLIIANKGGCDAESARILKVTKTFTNLRAVPSSILVMEGRSFVKKGSNISVRSWDELEGFSIAIVNGETYAMQATEGRHRDIASSYKNLFDMLIYRNIDVVIGTRVSSIREFAVNNRASAATEMLPTPLFHSILYHLVHKDKPELAKRINAAIIDLRKQGLMDQYVAEALADLTTTRTLE